MSAQQNLSPQEVAQMQEQGEIELVDVREPYEHEAGHIAGDRHVPMAELSGAAESIGRERPVVFYCRVGARSEMAAQAFRASGWDARNMDGGLVAWDRAGLPLEPEGGTVADH